MFGNISIQSGNLLIMINNKIKFIILIYIINQENVYLYKHFLEFAFAYLIYSMLQNYCDVYYFIIYLDCYTFAYILAKEN